ALGELRPLTGLLEPGLLALLLARIASEVAAALHLGAEGRVGLHEGARDAVPQGVRLRGHTAAVDASHHVHARVVARRLERLARRALEAHAREVLVEVAAVDRVGALTRLEDHAGDRALALPG